MRQAEGVHGAHGLGKLNHVCHELFALGRVRANVALAATGRVRRAQCGEASGSGRREHSALNCNRRKAKHVSRISAPQVCTPPLAGPYELVPALRLVREPLSGVYEYSTTALRDRS